MAVGLAITSTEGGQYKGKITRFVVLSCMVASTGGLIFGYDIGVSGPFLLTRLHFYTFIRTKGKDMLICNSLLHVVEDDLNYWFGFCYNSPSISLPQSINYWY